MVSVRSRRGSRLSREWPVNMVSAFFGWHLEEERTIGLASFEPDELVGAEVCSGDEAFKYQKMAPFRLHLLLSNLERLVKSKDEVKIVELEYLCACLGVEIASLPPNYKCPDVASFVKKWREYVAYWLSHPDLLGATERQSIVCTFGTHGLPKKNGDLAQAHFLAKLFEHLHRLEMDNLTPTLPVKKNNRFKNFVRELIKPQCSAAHAEDLESTSSQLETSSLTSNGISPPPSSDFFRREDLVLVVFTSFLNLRREKLVQNFKKFIPQLETMQGGSGIFDSLFSDIVLPQALDARQLLNSPTNVRRAFETLSNTRLWATLEFRHYLTLRSLVKMKFIDLETLSVGARRRIQSPLSIATPAAQNIICAVENLIATLANTSWKNLFPSNSNMQEFINNYRLRVRANFSRAQKIEQQWRKLLRI